MNPNASNIQKSSNQYVREENKFECHEVYFYKIGLKNQVIWQAITEVSKIRNPLHLEISLKKGSGFEYQSV